MNDDTLSIVLEHLGIEGSVFCRAELSAPWAVETQAMPSAIFHVIVAGSGYVRVGRRKPVAWRAGDLLLLPRGAGHAMLSDPRRRAVSIATLPSEPGPDGLPCVISEGEGPQTSLLCGTFRFGSDAELLLSELPELLHVSSASAASTWLDATLRLLAEEVAGARPGAHTVVSRLTEVLLVHALRVWLASTDNDSRGWLSALGDPVLSRALAELHREPARDWTVATLARRIGVSRSALYARFSDRLDLSPASYLARWRMVLARRALSEERSISEVAASVGYASEAAFSRAFKRNVGASPSAWRRAQR